MKDAVAEGLRVLWQELGNHPCGHDVREWEVGFAGVPTGNHVCVKCGGKARIDPAPNHAASKSP